MRRWQRVRQGAIAGGVVALLVVFVWANDLFTSSRLRLTDAYFVSSDASQTVVIVALDDASLQQYGRSPTEWSRIVYANLIDTVSAAGARVIAFDVLFSESTPEDSLMLGAIQRARQSDTRLRTVMAAAGVHPAEAAHDVPGFSRAIRFAYALLPTQPLLDAIDYVGYVNTFPDVDGSVRRQPSIVVIDDQPALSLSLAAYLAYLRVPQDALSLVATTQGNTLTLVESRRLEVDSLGFWRQHFSGPPFKLHAQTFPVVSMVDVLSGDVDPILFDDKIVLVGLINSAGISDQYTVPSAARGQMMSGVEIQANAIETLLQNRPLRELGSAAQILLIVGLALGSSLLYALLRWYIKIAAWAVLLAIVVAGAFVAFEFQHVIVELFDVALALTLAAIVSIGIDTTNEINRRRRSEFLLESVVQVSQQRLVLDKILPHVVADIHRIVPSATIVIWRWDQQASAPRRIFAWPHPDSIPAGDWDSRAALAGDTMSAHADGAAVVLPLAWQRRLVGVVAIVQPGGGHIAPRVVATLDTLAVQLAPSLENAFLYTELARQSAVQDAILTGSPAGIVVLDHDGRVRRINDAFHALFNVRGADYVGQSGAALLAALNLDESACQAVMAALKAGQPFHKEIRPDRRVFHLAAAPEEQFRLWVWVLSEVTQLHQLSELKTYIIRMLSHDLGNPLSRILGYSQLLLHERDTLSETSQQFLDYIIHDGEEMDRIISDVLNLEHLRSGEFAREHVDLRRLVSELGDRHQPAFAQKQHAFDLTLPDAPVYVDGNHRQLAQAITNLLNNAIKYTPDGGHIRMGLEAADPDRVRLVVADDGHGIPESAQASIFKEFYRVKTSATVGIRGTGLGLSLVKVVVENHGGRVWFESTEGMGSTFFIELPTTRESSAHCDEDPIPAIASGD